jgi:hypothetical protein
LCTHSASRHSALLLALIAVGCKQTEPTVTTTSDIDTSDSARSQCEELATEALPIAAKQLQVGGEFRPFAMARNKAGENVGVSAANAAENPQAMDVIAALQKALRDGGQRGDYEASVIVTTMTLANGGEALQLDLEHRSGYGKTMLIAYKRTAEGQVTVDDQGTVAHRNVVFTP